MSGALTPRDGAFKPKMAQPVVLVNDQSPKSNKGRVTPKGNALESLLNQVRNQINNGNGMSTPNYRERTNSQLSAGHSGIITPHSNLGGNNNQQLNLSQITQLLKNAQQANNNLGEGETRDNSRKPSD